MLVLLGLTLPSSKYCKRNEQYAVYLVYIFLFKEVIFVMIVSVVMVAEVFCVVC